MRPLPYLPRVRRHLAPAIMRGGNTHTFADAVLCVLKGEMQLWSAEGGSVVTQIIIHPRKRQIHWIWAGGDMGQVLAFQNSIRSYGKAHGCAEMTLAGRTGWGRVLKSHGWAGKGIIMEATL